jgi:hypothetical protein
MNIYGVTTILDVLVCGLWAGLMWRFANKTAVPHYISDAVNRDGSITYLAQREVLILLRSGQYFAILSLGICYLILLYLGLWLGSGMIMIAVSLIAAAFSFSMGIINKIFEKRLGLPAPWAAWMLAGALAVVSLGCKIVFAG